jgi:hypothetical protein
MLASCGGTISTHSIFSVTTTLVVTENIECVVTEFCFLVKLRHYASKYSNVSVGEMGNVTETDNGKLKTIFILKWELLASEIQLKFTGPNKSN